jgi:hypothetical protein
LVEGWNRNFWLPRQVNQAVNEARSPRLTGLGLTGIVPVADSERINRFVERLAGGIGA